MRVMVVDTQPLVRSGMRVALDDDGGFEVIAAGATVEQTAGRAGTRGPDVVVLGASDAPDAITAVQERWPRARLLWMTATADPLAARRAFELGVTGIVLRTVEDDELVRAVRSVSAGERYVTPAVGAALAGIVRDREGLAGLSAREQDVLRLLALGLTNRQVAERLVVSIRTVEGHRAHLMAKLGVTSRAELVRHALTTGMLDDDIAEG